jgi:membrane protein DedA with SNARE-associated domain
LRPWQLRSWSRCRPSPSEGEGPIDRVLTALADLPPLLTYLVLAAGAAAENIVPPIPADTFVLFGAFLAARGRADLWIVWAATWLANVGSAMVVYALARRFGQTFFDTRLGRLILHRRQLEGIGRFYGRWGELAIFFGRFLPGFRAVVPIFAGVTGLTTFRTLLPVLAASGLWYGVLVLVGQEAGRNWTAIEGTLSRYLSILGWIAVPLVVLLAVWWWRSRRHDRDRGG